MCFFEVNRWRSTSFSIGSRAYKTIERLTERLKRINLIVNISVLLGASLLGLAKSTYQVLWKIVFFNPMATLLLDKVLLTNQSCPGIFHVHVHHTNNRKWEDYKRQVCLSHLLSVVPPDLSLHCQVDLDTPFSLLSLLKNALLENFPHFGDIITESTPFRWQVSLLRSTKSKQNRYYCFSRLERSSCQNHVSYLSHIAIFELKLFKNWVRNVQ